MFLSLLMLVFNWKMNRNVIFLVLNILTTSIYTTTYNFVAVEQSRFWGAVFYANLAPLWYLPGPCLYWYVRGNLEDRIRLRKTDWLHLIPFFLSLIGIFPYLLTPFEHKLKTVDLLFLDPDSPKNDPPNWLIPVSWNLLLRPALVMIYATWCIGWILRVQRFFTVSTVVARGQWIFLRNWMIILSSILLLMSLPSFFLSYYYSTNIHADFSGINAYAMSSVTVYSQTVISLTLLVFPRILYGIPRVTLPRQEDTIVGLSLSPESISEPESERSREIETDPKDKGQQDEPFIALSQRILQFMEEQKPYIELDFTLEMLAKGMDVPKHHLYYCFQNIMKTKFTRLRTTYRIEHAKKLLIEADLSKTTLNILGKESGFASTSAFYTTFKTEVGCSPGEYAAKLNPTYQV